MIQTLLLTIAYPIFVHSSVCPFFKDGTPPSNDDLTIPDVHEYNEELYNLDIRSVFTDIDNALTDSQDCWPADTFNGNSNYGPLFIRLAWHCSGTYRTSDGRGGCAGGRQRFSPEASWEDNTNLDKARALLAPIKEKYGDALSWGDLFVFAGTASILHMGGPVNTICAGRVDDVDGTLSEPLDEPCDDQGNCGEPHGPSTVGLIYVNPEGVLGNPDPVPSGPRIREIFYRMDMDDRETVALIGGGHAFGKSHGACPDGAGLPPDESPLNPWPGLCGTGKGEDTFTSGIEGQWTSNPLKWDNEYFQQLVNDDYTLITGPGGAHQWKNDRTGYMMMTTDLALVHDDEYKKIVTEYANDIHALDTAFAGAWEKLVTNGGYGSWAQNKKCIDAKELYNDEAAPVDGFWEWLSGGGQNENEDEKKDDEDEEKIGDNYDGTEQVKYGRWDNGNGIQYEKEDDEEYQPPNAVYGGYGARSNNWNNNYQQHYTPYYKRDEYHGGYNARSNNWDNKHSGDEEICYLPADAGVCRAYLERYYYNQYKHQCELFIYGGCQGNPNNFESLDKCHRFAERNCY